MYYLLILCCFFNWFLFLLFCFLSCWAVPSNWFSIARFWCLRGSVPVHFIHLTVVLGCPSFFCQGIQKVGHITFWFCCCYKVQEILLFHTFMNSPAATTHYSHFWLILFLIKPLVCLLWKFGTIYKEFWCTHFDPEP